MKKVKFTFVEVLIASLILAFSAVVAVEMTTSTHLQTFDVEDQWATEHLLSLGCEFYLMFGHEADFPSDMLPEGFSIGCELEPGIIPEGADEEKYDPISGWILGEYIVTLFREGEEIGKTSIEKIVPEDILQ